MGEKISSIEHHPQVNLEGYNLGKIETRYFGDMQHLRSVYQKYQDGEFEPLDEEVSETIKKLENLFKEAQESINPSQIKGLEINSDGKVVLQEGQIFHMVKAPRDRVFDDLKMLSIARYGIIASEWFGMLESESEGRLCAFFSTIKEKRIGGGAIMMTIDYQNPDLQKLLKLDFFRYSKIKAENPESLNREFSELELEILTLIDDNSPCGRRMYEEEMHPEWKAIGGGIPARFINGICIDSVMDKSDKPENYHSDGTFGTLREITTENITRLAELFPSATIFRRDGTVLHQPQEIQINTNINNNETN